MDHPAETDRRLGDLLRYGAVCEVAGARCRVSLGEGFETDWIDIPMTRAGALRAWSQYSMGEQVCLACPDGDIVAATILCSRPSTAFPAPADPEVAQLLFDDGCRLAYDHRSHGLEAGLPAGGRVTITASAGIKLIGDVDIEGALKATGEISSDTDVKVATVSLKNHDHVETGALTKKPRQ